MVRMPSRPASSALVALLLFVLASALAFSATFSTERLTIRKADGTVHAFTVELAISADQRAQGLMNRREMADDHGMLFDFGLSRRAAMWMKNTYLPLDMLFIRKDGTIARIAADTEPQSEAIIDSREPVHFVLELNAGASSRLGIAAGDKVESATIAAAAAKP
jgi:uncharacterized membrane protein (UPF0127 family)